MSKFAVGTLAFFLVATPVCLAAAGAQPAPPAAPADTGAQLFAKEIRPLLVANCVPCHGGEKPQGGLRLTSREALLKGGASGPSVVLAKPRESLLLAAVNYQGRRMPPRGKMAQAQIDALTRWVETGLPWPAGDSASLETKTHAGPPPVNEETMRFWAFQPVRLPALPAVKVRAWVKNPIDAFVLKRLEDRGLSPSPPADPATLVRRVTYDLTGLPPTPEEVDQFVRECESERPKLSPRTDKTGQNRTSVTSPTPYTPHPTPTPPFPHSPIPPHQRTAYERLVDRLLASPHYGERWGRHWLDLIRFAESNSYERDGTKDHAWRYRDYVIRSLNEDKPYDRFVTEQLAGDELAPRTPERLIATGYYRLGIWDDEPVDPEQALYDDLDDIASTTGQVFLGLTVGCARCHDHKIDPIPQKDYYRFLSFFSGLKRFGVRSQESVEEASYRSIASEEELKRLKDALAANQAALGEIEAKVLPDLQPVEKEEWRSEFRRIALVRARVGRLITREELDSYMRLQGERRRLQRAEPMALCVKEIGTTPREMFVALRGNPHVRGDKVEPGFLSVLAPPEPKIEPAPLGDSSGRRLALARWITSKENPLTARVLVNRVWQYHFGRGLVRSSSNFGFQGDKPTHPELLDYLAFVFTQAAASDGNDREKERLRDRGTGTPNGLGWSLKKLHRLILLSNTYQQSSASRPVQSVQSAKSADSYRRSPQSVDPENDLFWRFDMRRLTAEELRDSILAANGSLNPAVGGPSVFPDIPQEVLAGQSMPGAGWGKSTPEEQCRRSVYVFVKRSLPLPIVASFDGPETDFSCPVRFATTQPTQALGMMNSKWVNDQARVFAAYLKKTAGDDPAAQVRLALQRTLQRLPTAAEVGRGVRLIEALQRDEKATPDDALAGFCLVALNLNEFIYID